MRLKSLVIVDQQATVNYKLNSVHTAHHVGEIKLVGW